MWLHVKRFEVGWAVHHFVIRSVVCFVVDIGVFGGFLNVSLSLQPCSSCTRIKIFNLIPKLLSQIQIPPSLCSQFSYIFVFIIFWKPGCSQLSLWLTLSCFFSYRSKCTLLLFSGQRPTTWPRVWSGVVVTHVHAADQTTDDCHF